MSDLQRAFAALNGKVSEYDKLFNYAEGIQPLVYSTQRLIEAFRDIRAHFQQGWCSVVIDAAMDRIVLKGLAALDADQTRQLAQVWHGNQVQLEAYEAHRSALITGEAFVIVWKNEAGEFEIYYNDPRLCHVFYEADNPKKKEFAAKWYADESEGTWRMTLYYEDRLEYYSSNSKDRPSTARSFHPDEEAPVAPNPYGEIPVFHLRTSRSGAKSDMNGILSLQDAVNKLLADMMVAAEYGAFKQRYVISNADTGALKNSPSEIWSIPAGDGVGQQTQVGEFSETNLGMYLDAIDKLASSIGVISRTPKHYFYTAGANLSGEALLAMESPLVKRVVQREENFSPTWQEIGAFILKLESNQVVEPAEIMTVWAPPSTIQPRTEAETRQLAVTAGLPLITQLRREGWAESDIKMMQQDQADQQSANTADVGSSLLTAMRKLDSTNPAESVNPNDTPKTA